MNLFLDKLILHRGERRIVGPLDASLSGGGYLSVQGPNGSGKSTLLRAIAELLPVKAGTIALNGDRISDENPRREYCHYVGHLDGLKSALTVSENLSFFQKLYREDSVGNSIEEALNAVALPQTIDLPVGYLSAGMRKRIGLARLLLNHRPLWLLDEPTSALDAASQERLGFVMQSHLENGGMIVAATHIPLPGTPGDVLELQQQPLLDPTTDEVWL